MNPVNRPLTSEEIAYLKKGMDSWIVIATVTSAILAIVMTSACAFSLNPSTTAGILTGFVLGYVFLGAICYSGWRALKNDRDKCVAETIKGRVEKKWMGSEIQSLRQQNYLMVKGEVFDLKPAFWKKVDVGDDIIIERTPAGKFILNVEKQTNS